MAPEYGRSLRCNTKGTIPEMIARGWARRDEQVGHRGGMFRAVTYSM